MIYFGCSGVNQFDLKITKVFFRPSGSSLRSSSNLLFANCGGGLFITEGTKQDREFLNVAVENAKSKGEQILLSGHSAGGRRNYQNLYGADRNQFLDKNGNSILNVQFYGSPVNANDIAKAAERSGANLLGVDNNNGDFVGNGLGDNGGNGQIMWSTVPGMLLLPSQWSPHSNYDCTHALCNNNQKE